MLEQKVMSFHDIVNDDSEPPPPIIDDGVLLDRSLLIDQEYGFLKDL